MVQISNVLIVQNGLKLSKMVQKGPQYSTNFQNKHVRKDPKWPTNFQNKMVRSQEGSGLFRIESGRMRTGQECFIQNPFPNTGDIYPKTFGQFLH